MVSSIIYYHTFKRLRPDERFEAIYETFPNCAIEKRKNWHESDLAIIQGWTKPSSIAPHNKFRKDVIKRQFNMKKHVLTVDGNIFDYLIKNVYFRYSIDGVFANNGYYFDDIVDPKRWDNIRRAIGCDLKPWRKSGSHVLILMQKDSGWTMEGIDCVQWCVSTIDEIRRHTDRKIVVRLHPSDIKQIDRYVSVIRDPMTVVSTNRDIREDLLDAWCSITYNSSPGAVSVIEGVPTFIMDPNWEKSPAAEVGNTDIRMIEEPLMLERERWIQKIAMSHYNTQDIKDGLLWKEVNRYFSERTGS